MDVRELGNRIKSFRNKLNLTQNSLANALCISPQAVSKWENGDNAPDISILPKLSLLFGISIDTLLGRPYECNNTFEASIFVSDIEFFTNRTKPMDPREIATIVNGHFYQLTEIVLTYDAVPVKYVGDEFLCFFSGENHRKRAVQAALKAKQNLMEPVSIGIGTGEIFLGKIGHPDYAQTDIMGNCINHAHRLCYWAREHTKSKIATYENTLKDIIDEVETGYVEDFKPSEKAEPIKLYEVVGIK